MTETFQRFVQASFEEASPNGGPTLQQMAALSAYTKAAMLAQKETNFFTPTIYSQISSTVLSQKYPAVYFAGHFYPYREDGAITRTTTNDNDVDGSVGGGSGDDTTKDFDSSTGSEDTLNTTEISSKDTPNAASKPSTKRYLISEQTPSTSSPPATSTTTTVTSSSQKVKRERKPPQRYVPEDNKIDEGKETAATVEDDDDYSNDSDDGPPMLEKIDTTPLPSSKSSKKSVKKNNSFVETPPKTLSSNGFKHPKKAINFDKTESPQLVPNAPFSPQQQYSDPTEPLEEWFLSNLTNPFPTQKEFSRLQYLSNFGHLDIQKWFQSRRKIFCKQNPKSRPWANSKKSAAAVKRLSSSDEENNGDKLMDKVVAKKLKTIKLEISELDGY